jgi:amino acid adenylation domain-containing protein
VPRGTPLFETLLAFENFPVESTLREQGSGGRLLAIRDVHLRERVNYPVAAVAVPREGLLLRLKVDPGRVDSLTAERMLGHWRTLLEGMAEGPAVPIAEIPLLTAAERQQTLVERRATAGPVHGCLHERFAAQVERAPGATAAVFQGESLTYGELDRRAGRLAVRLGSLGVGPEALVGVCLEPCLDLVVAVLGVLKAGGAYVPLDPTYPPERLRFLVEDSGIRVLVGPPDGPAAAFARGVPLVDPGAPAEPGPDHEAAAVLPGHPAYVIYTSGSTGRPKGVTVTHANVVRLFEATAPWFGFGPEDAWSLFHSYAFDFSVWEIWGALLHGGRLVIVPAEVRRSPELFYDLLADERVTVLNQTPSAFRQLLWTEAARPAPRPLALRLVIFGGEALDPSGLEPWFSRHGDARPRLVNMYGITETTVHVTYRPLDASDARGGQGSMVGVAIPDLEAHVLDPGGEPLPAGVPGELAVGGAGLARGYLGRPGLTAERFVPHPFSVRPGERLYRSGDLARWSPDGELEYLGRIDHQVKIRGFRVELGEIEAALGGHPAVRECVVVARDPEDGDRRLAAYLTDHRQPAPPAFELREHLAARLPEYMVPASFTVLPALPLTAHGKMDRRALPEPESGRPELRESFVEPRNDLEAAVAAMWAEVLGLESVGVGDGFFELGGNSLLAMQLVWRMEEAFRVELPLSALFEAGTVAALAGLLAAGEARPGEMQKIARVLRRVRQMSAVDVQGLLAEKRKGHGG